MEVPFVQDFHLNQGRLGSRLVIVTARGGSGSGAQGNNISCWTPFEITHKL